MDTKVRRNQFWTEAMKDQRIEFNGTCITERVCFPPPSGSPYFYLTLNAEVSLACEVSEELKKVNSSPRTRVSVDGQWILWALRRKYPGIPIEKLAGSDLIFRLAEHCGQTGKRLMLLGSSERNNRAAVAVLRQRFAGASIEGYAPPVFDARSRQGEAVRRLIRERIAEVKPDFIICGFGTPKEQEWAWPERDWLDSNGIAGTFFFGGAIDFASGAVRRAPLAWQKWGLEGVYRVICQPQRLTRFLRVTRLLPRLLTGRY